MPKLNLPEYAKCDKIGKNEIIRILESKVEVEIISTEPDCITLQSNEGKTFYIQGSSAVLDKSKGPVLTTEGSPDLDRILSGDQEVSWSWHPSEDLNTDQIRKSWINQLSLREEIKEAGMEQSGFRTPQLGAIHAALAHWAVSDGIATVVMPTGTGNLEVLSYNKCFDKLIKPFEVNFVFCIGLSGIQIPNFYGFHISLYLPFLFSQNGTDWFWDDVVYLGTSIHHNRAKDNAELIATIIQP